MKAAPLFPACPICGGSRIKKLFTYRRFRYVKCAQCHLVWMNPLIKDETESDDYDHVNWPSYRQFILTFRLRQFEKDLTSVEKFCPAKGYLLDIGTGTGEFLTVASSRGFMAYGIEPSKKASQVAAKMGHVLRGELESLSLKENFFDVVTCWSVLEHIPQPNDFLQKIHRLLKKNGLLALRLPLASSLLFSVCLWLYRLGGQKISWPLRQFFQLDWQSKHVYLFNESNLLRLLSINNFQPLGVRKEPGFDLPSLWFRFDWKAKNILMEKASREGLRLILFLSRLQKKQDELIIIARKKQR